MDFIRCLRHTCGRWAGQKFTLLPWQEHEIIRPLFGTLTDGGVRRYRTVYVSVPKKNGKTELGAAVGLKFLVADGEPGAEVYAAAADRFQASKVSNASTRMVELDSVLSRTCNVIASQKRIIYPDTGSFLITLSRDSFTKHGLNIHAVLFDELHAQKDRDFYDTLTFGVGAARTQHVIFIMTTAGYDRNSICWEVHDHALRVLKFRDPDRWDWVPGLPIDDPTFLPVVYSLKEDEDWRDEENWKKVNPSFDHIFNINDIRDEFRGADDSVAHENNFRRFRLNQWVKQSVRWINMDAWDACDQGRLKRRHLRGRPCYTALDLSSNTDITAMVSVLPPESDGEPYDVVCRFFIPEDNMRDRVRRDHVPYDQWAREGFVTTTPGNAIDYRFIVREVLDWAETVDLREVPYDRWGAALTVTDLEDEGVIVVPFGQGMASMSQPTKDVETLVLKKQLNHQGNPVLRWMADNCVVETDAAGGIKINKKKSTERVDGMVALVMALGRAMKNEGGTFRSVYEDRGAVEIEVPNLW